MTSCVTDDEIDSSNNVAPTNSDSISPSTYCYFTNLHPNIEFDILKQMEFEDYRNLALTCKRWHRAAVSARLSMKPELHFNSFNMRDARLIRRGNLQRYLDFKRISFQFVKKVNCKTLIISKGKDSHSLQTFLLENRSRFKFDSIRLDMDYMKERNYVFMQPLINLAPEIRWNGYWKNKISLLRFFEDHLSHESIIIQVSENTECFRLILKQWVTGERPNLDYMSYTMSYPPGWSELTRGLEEFVTLEEEFGCLGDFWAEIFVPGLPDLALYCYDRCVEVKRKYLPRSP